MLQVYLGSNTLEGACCCVLHGNGVPTTGQDTREEVASDHSMVEAGDQENVMFCALEVTVKLCGGPVGVRE